MFRQILANNAFQRRNLLCFVDHPSLFRFISTTTQHKKTFTISYLVNSCGLSQQRAITISQKLQFDSSTNPDTVLNLLRNNGFSDSQISKIITTFPKLLLVFNVNKTLKPKFDFFNSKGLSGADFGKAISREPSVLGNSLDKVIIPSFDFLKSIVGTDEKVRAILISSMGIITRIKTVEFNIAILRSHDVPVSNIRTFLVYYPRVLRRNSSRFIENVEEVKKMKFDTSQYLFLLAMKVMDGMSKSSLKAKFEVYKSWGWSDDQVQCAFRKFPLCMMLSEKNIMSTMDYLVNKFGYAPSSIAEQPDSLMFSCEKRIIPRCAAIQILVKNGKVEQPTSYTFLHLSEVVFMKKYIRRFEKEVPEVLRAYQGEAKVNRL